MLCIAKFELKGSKIDYQWVEHLSGLSLILQVHDNVFIYRLHGNHKHEKTSQKPYNKQFSNYYHITRKDKTDWTFLTQRNSKFLNNYTLNVIVKYLTVDEFSLNKVYVCSGVEEDSGEDLE